MNKTVKRLGISLAIALILLLAACSAGGPGGVVEEYVRAAQKLDETAMAQCMAVPAAQSTLSQSQKTLLQGLLSGLSVSIDGEDISGGSATVDVTLTVPDFNGAFDYVLAHRMEELMAIAFSDQTEEERTEATVALFLEAIQQDGKTTRLSGPLHLTKVDGSWKIEQDESFDALFSNLFSAPDVVEAPLA